MVGDNGNDVNNGNSEAAGDNGNNINTGDNGNNINNGNSGSEITGKGAVAMEGVVNKVGGVNKEGIIGKEGSVDKECAITTECKVNWFAILKGEVYFAPRDISVLVWLKCNKHLGTCRGCRETLQGWRGGATTRWQRWPGGSPCGGDSSGTPPSGSSKQADCGTYNFNFEIAVLVGCNNRVLIIVYLAELGEGSREAGERARRQQQDG